MPELRQDPVTGHRVLIAPERLSRPIETGKPPEVVSQGRCPFCRGNEELTPGAVAVFPDAESKGKSSGDGGWLIRIIPNRYPAVSVPQPVPQPDQKQAIADDTLPGSASSQSRKSIPLPEPPLPEPPVPEPPVPEPPLPEPAAGYHEVIVESPSHQRAMHELSPEQFERVVRAWRDRLAEMNRRGSIAHTMIFRNEGAAAGASLEHVHSQLLATSFIPDQIDRELEAAKQYFEAGGADRAGLRSEPVERELADSSRLVIDAGRFVLLCPFASRFAGEMCLLPRTRAHAFDDVLEDEIAEVASLLRQAVLRLQAVFPQAAFNLGIHSAPPGDPRCGFYRWHIQIAPRITGIAGFELMSGSWINVIAPEDAARRYRNAAY